jgi:hypothetical protein
LALILVASTMPALSEVVDDFSEGGWRVSNSKAPAKVTAEKGRLILQDLPGGEVTWGSSAAKVFSVVDISSTRYIIFDVARMTGSFGAKLAGGKEWPKKTVCRAFEPGQVVVDIPQATGWKPGKGKLNVMVYTHGDGSSMELRSIRITDKLTTEEAEKLKQTPQTKTRPAPGPRAGLKALGERRGMKPFSADPKAGERTVYIDPTTGHRVWRMTDHPSIERHVYYDILAWNADGSRLLFLSRRAGGSTWMMDADGSNIRPFPALPDGSIPTQIHWSPTHPDLVYFARPEEKSLRVMSFDIQKRTVEGVASVPFGQKFEDVTFSELPPPHPDERHFLLRWGGQDRNETMLVVVDSQTGKHWRMDTGIPTHRVRFSKKSDLSVFVNSNSDPARPGQKARTEWIVNLDGTKRRLPKGGGHPDWSPDGSWLSAYSGGGIVLVSHDGKTRKMLVKTLAGGHGGFSTTGRFHVSDSPGSGTYANLVYVTELATGSVRPICFHGSSYSGWRSGVPDPEATHPAPICSPDETKIVYDSDMLGQPDVWVAIWKLPGVPQDVRFENGALSWQPPKLHREIAGYNIFRKQNDQWVQTGERVEGTRLAGLADGDYAVASIEHSGLESRYAMAGSNALTTNALAPARCGDPKVMETGITHVVLQWPSSSEPDLDHYNVYASAGQDAVPSLATLVGSPKAAKFVDWGLQPGATYHYRVTSVDRQGNESVPGSSARATTKAVAAETVRIELEAEKGKCQPPMEVGKSSDASGGAYVHVPDAYSDGPYVIGGKLEFSFEVPADGVFDFWGRALGLDGGSNSFFVSLDGSTPANWGVPVPRQGEPRFMWHRISGLEGAPLRKGRHVLVVSSREDGTRIDKIVITNEPNAKFTD